MILMVVIRNGNENNRSNNKNTGELNLSPPYLYFREYVRGWEGNVTVGTKTCVFRAMVEG